MDFTQSMPKSFCDLGTNKNKHIIHSNNLGLDLWSTLINLNKL